ncbi:MAG: CBASS cGAMP-activated phospholipase [Opitutaceae bacterium]|jgi:hypothetical protein
MPALVNHSRVQILAIDGGGFRGLFAAKCLAHWEETTGKRTADCFDLICGTSTGGILALGLGLGIPANELVNFYLEDGRAMFPTSPLARSTAWLRHWALPKLSRRPLRDALQCRLGRDALLGDSRTRLVIPSYDLSVQRPYLFKTDHHPDYKTDWKRPAWEVAMATSAAPTYYRYHASSWNTAYIDGGIWANNPSMVGAFEATEILGAAHKNIRILNLGTGIVRGGSGKPSFSRSLGIAGWAGSISELILDANALSVAGIAERIYRENYVRVAPAIDSAAVPLDRYAPQQLLSLAADRARFHAGAAETFFNHVVVPYSKSRPCIQTESRIERKIGVLS